MAHLFTRGLSEATRETFRPSTAKKDLERATLAGFRAYKRGGSVTHCAYRDPDMVQAWESGFYEAARRGERKR